MDFEKATLQLGMNACTAQGRLQRRIMFMLVQKAGLDLCYRCGKRIERIEDFSIDHKHPWFDINPSLFWDLDNIAFSHLKCNTEARRKKRAVWTPELRKQFSNIQKARFLKNPLTEEQKHSLAQRFRRKT
jgi:hypothetical protein